MRFRHLKNDRGWSLVEVLIALSVLGVVSAAIMKSYVVQHENYMTQEDISYVQQSARSAIEELTRQIRMAGYGVPEGVDAIIARDGNPDSIEVWYQVDNCDSYLSAAMAMTTSPLTCANVTCFVAGERLYIYEPATDTGEWFVITSIDPTTKQVGHTAPLSRLYAANSFVLRMNQVRFFIDNVTDPEHPKLMMRQGNGVAQVFADNIVDLQLQYRLENGTKVDLPPLSKDIRDISIKVTGRSAQANPDDQDEPYRLKSYNSTVNVRNLS